MDLIYTDPSKSEKGVLKDFSVDFEISTVGSDNTFEIKQDVSNKCMDIGSYWYAEGLEYGGRVDDIKLDTKYNTIYYKGLTWRGILDAKIVCPPDGEDYYVAQGDLTKIIDDVIKRESLTGLFKVKLTTTKTVTQRWPRYESVYYGLNYVLAKHGYKLVCKWDDGKVELSAEPRKDWSSASEISSDLFDFVMEINKGAPNHIIALGKGTGKDRLVIHRYIGADGTASDTQYYFGMDEIAQTYDVNTEEDPDKLTEKADEKLEEWAVQDYLEVTANDIEADIGDRFSATSEDLGLSIVQFVTGKITNITDHNMKVSYAVGSAMW